MRIERVSADEVLQLRRPVLRPGQPDAASNYPTDDAPTTVHVAAYSADDELICVASIAIDPAPATVTTDVPLEHQWRLRGMATADSVRGTGIGSQVLPVAIELARSSGAQLFWCNARSPARTFYERQGWTVVGEEFDLPDIGPHFVMRLG